MYRRKMSSISESLSSKGINIRIYNQPKSTSQNKHQDEELGRLKVKKNDGPLIPRRYFLLCQTCFWCASYIGARHDFDECPIKRAQYAMIFGSSHYLRHTTNVITSNIPQLEESC